MKSFFFCLGLAALPVCGTTGGAHRAPVTLYTQFPSNPPAVVIDAMRSEVQAIMSPLGISLEWRGLDTAGEVASPELAVVSFKGRCDLEGKVTRNPNPGPLGWTHLTDGVIIPFADIDCEAIRSFLQRDLQLEKPDVREGVFGRALGRVLAHELYHIFANTTHHGTDGVGRGSYSVQDLLTPTFRFEDRESTALITTLAHSSASSAPDASNPDDPQHSSRQ